jgi:pimeloyl-ACP methyl ester carboxylesterase
MPHVDVNGARLWFEEEGEGPAVLFVHGGLGDLRLWEPEAPALAPSATTFASGDGPKRRARSSRPSTISSACSTHWT